jgi:anti-anti-sigma factor
MGVTTSISREFSFKVTRQLSAVVVAVYGELDIAASTRLGAVLQDLIDGQGNLNVVVDLQCITSVDSAALGVLATAHETARGHGGHLKIDGPSDGPNREIADTLTLAS